MCQFCVEHGEGKRWYLEAQNYAFDLESDLKRREYIVDFIAGFEDMRATAIAGGNLLDRMPSPLTNVVKNAVTRHQKKHHFGQPLSLEDCEAVFDTATSITAIPCICRMHERGKTADEVCLLVTTQPIHAVLADGFADYADGPGLDDFHTLERDEAVELLRECEEAGLMHSIWTFQTPFTAAICNCNLASGCLAMKMTVGYGVKVMWRGEDVASLSAEECSGCRRCIRVCPFGALSAHGRGPVTLDITTCWGCGICRSVCDSGAITLADRRSVPAVADLW